MIEPALPSLQGGFFSSLCQPLPCTFPLKKDQTMPSPYYICGPTASGKTRLALQMADEFDGEIVNADAFQIYRGLEILSAAPTVEERNRAPHHLFSVQALAEKMDAARYFQLAAPVIADIQKRGKTPIIVGGSGLYLKFLTHGPAPAPPGDQNLRTELEKLSLSEIINRLRELDPKEAAHQTKQNSGNRRHLSRALEICLLTGKPASSFRRNFAQTPPDLRGTLITWPRALLRERIVERTELMLRNGALNEVRALPEEAGTVTQAIGVPEIRAFLSGDLDLPGTLEKIVTATSRYAKRQENWFRKENWLTSRDGRDL